jgi:hypothetical protein
MKQCGPENSAAIISRYYEIAGTLHLIREARLTKHGDKQRDITVALLLSLLCSGILAVPLTNDTVCIRILHRICSMDS